MYPLLNEDEIQRMRLLCLSVHLKPGDVLYAPGDDGVALYLLLTVSVPIVQPDLIAERPVTVLSPRMFTGEAGMIGGQRAVVIARALNMGEAVKVAASDLRALVVREPILSNTPIVPLFQTELTSLTGEESLRQVSWNEEATGQTHTRDVKHIFIMAGASPNSRWLRGSVALDTKGFILTGRELPVLNHSWISPPWTLKRPPHLLETSLPGIFAVGDVRAGSTKRVASAVGEGAVAVSLVHRVLHDADLIPSLS